MPIQTRYASFDLHQSGKTASDRVRDAAKVFRGDAATGTLDFTDANRDFGAEGFSGAVGETIQILDGGGNIQREVAITVVAGSVLTVGGTNFDQNGNNLRYRVWIAPSTTEIVDDPTKRGLGLIGWQEMLDKIESGMSANFLSQHANVTYSEGLTQQSVTFDYTESPAAVIIGGDIQIGAVEIKDQDTDFRANVEDGATFNRLLVQIANGTALVDLGAIMAPHLGAAPASAVLAGLEVIVGVPAQETDGDIATPWMNEFRQLVPWGGDLGQNAQQITDVASALLLSSITSFAALTAPGATPWVSAENFHHNTFVYVVATINTSVDVRAEHSPDGGTTVSNMDDDEVDTQKLANGAFTMHKPNFKAGHVRFNFVGEGGGTAAVITPFLMQGN